MRGLAAGDGPWPERVVVVDDRRTGYGNLLDEGLPETVMQRIEVIRSGGNGPAAARNVGWRASSAPWVAFLDDDVVPRPGWRAALCCDLAPLSPGTGGSQGRLHVLLPQDRAATDWQRNVAGLEAARWATADMAYRRVALTAVGGFDERFRRAYREDADLALRVMSAGYSLIVGDRTVDHPPRPAPWWVSIRAQAGNADDALMRRLHGRAWRRRSAAGRGRTGGHAVTTAALLAALIAPRSTVRRRAALGTWLALTGEFALRRILAGPRTAREVATMGVTSVLIPPTAIGYRFVGRARAHRLVRRRLPAAVLFDRDGTLVRDVAYNGDPDAVVPVAGAREALDRLRVARIPTAVISNQSGVARGLLGPKDVGAVNARIEELLGPLGPWVVCPHGPGDGCLCRKPEPGLVYRAAALLGVDPARCTVVGDIGADVEAARRAGARAVLVPNEATRRDEIEAAAVVAPDLGSAVDLLIGPRR